MYILFHNFIICHNGSYSKIFNLQHDQKTDFTSFFFKMASKGRLHCLKHWL